jgi:dTDP-4-dehydrorhamnose reductase
LIVGVFLKNNILLTGGSGTLGKTIINKNIFKKIYYPTKKKLNILNFKNLEKFIISKKISLIIHCAALARVKECEKYPLKAMQVNVNGTVNIVNIIQKIKLKYNKNIKLVFISSDAVYASTKGNYSEHSILEPYNVYGWTKLAAESHVKILNKHLIIRTRFFDKNKISFKKSANNIFTSSLEVNELVTLIHKLINKNVYGIINVGRKKISDYDNYKVFKKDIKPCSKNEIMNKLNFKIATDASLNLVKLKKFL